MGFCHLILRAQIDDDFKLRPQLLHLIQHLFPKTLFRLDDPELLIREDDILIFRERVLHDGKALFPAPLLVLGIPHRQKVRIALIRRVLERKRHRRIDKALFGKYLLIDRKKPLQGCRARLRCSDVQIDCTHGVSSFFL